jgi:phytoene dehydrogenase-like protein
MSAKNLSTVANELIATSGKTASNVIKAYRAGGELMVDMLNQRWNRAMRQSRPELSAETAKNAAAARSAFTSYYTQGLDVTAEGAQQVVKQIVKVAEAGVERAAANAALFEVKTGVTTLNTIAKATAPGAVVLAKLADKIEEKSALLARKLQTTPATGKRTSAFSQRRKAA